MRESQVRRRAETAGRRMPSPRPQWQNLFVAPVYGPDVTQPWCEDALHDEPVTTVPARRRAAGPAGQPR
ncbi:hypothetical protein GTW43_22090 [Streptomyces sp. SID5785]|uniref:hypothetical protein n=1 Tax=Streptomyces sp. SID5785 TaxID=2690309 RepID=UPI0013617625|nr:hypothetical protein [Streptomyces sp. SID5785]MZD07750.1 hypothetical protein [Streptomyces sp. SID5785]